MIFSIIIPIYNAELTLERCLNSVLEQSFEDFEVIMVNDGSRDASEKICLEYVNKDTRFRYFKQENSGVSSTRNYGIGQANGEFITFLDSDDVYYENYLESFFLLIQSYPGKNHYWCGFKYISDSLEQNGKEVKYITDDKIVLSDRDQILFLHEMGLDASPVNKVYRKKILDEHLIRMKKDISLGEDLIFNFDYLDCCKDTQIVICNEANYGYFCFSENSLNHKYRGDLQEIYSVLLNVMYKYLVKWNLFDVHKISYYNIAFYMYDTVLRNTFHPKNDKPYTEKIKFNNQILNSESFQRALKNSEVSVNKIYQYIYRFKRYEMILLVDKLLEIKRRR